VRSTARIAIRFEGPDGAWIALELAGFVPRGRRRGLVLRTAAADEPKYMA